MANNTDLVAVDEGEMIDITPRKRLKRDGISTTARRQTFAREYISNGFNAPKAAMAAGYTKTNIYFKAKQLMDHPEVQKTIQRILEPKIKKADITLEKVLIQLAAIANFDKRKLYNDDGTMKHIKDLDEETALAISHIGKDDVIPFDKLKALDMSLKFLGAYERDNLQKAPNLKLQVVLV